MKLYEIREEYQRILDNEDLESEETIVALNDIEEAFEEKADNVACLVKSLKAEEDAVKAEMMALDKRKKSINRKLENIKEYLKNEMMFAGKQEIKTARNTISFRRTKSVEVFDEATLDERFLRIKKEPNKTEIKVALEDGEIIDGARMVENLSLQVR